MDTYAVIQYGIVINVVVWDGESGFAPPEGCQLVLLTEGGIGWSYNNGVFTPPIIIEGE